MPSRQRKNKAKRRAKYLQTRDDVLESARACYKAEPEKKRTTERERYQAESKKKRFAERKRYQAEPEKKRTAERKRYQAEPEKKRTERESYQAEPEKKRAAKRQRYWESPESARAAKRGSPRASENTFKRIELPKGMSYIIMYRVVYISMFYAMCVADHVTPSVYRLQCTFWLVHGLTCNC